CPRGLGGGGTRTDSRASGAIGFDQIRAQERIGAVAPFPGSAKAVPGFRAMARVDARTRAAHFVGTRGTAFSECRGVACNGPPFAQLGTRCGLDASRQREPLHVESTLRSIRCWL